jgi:DNA-binding XRE family transcriptional regulator
MMTRFSGRKLREMRVRAGMSQEALALRIGKRPNEISRLETTERVDPHGSTLFSLARELSCRVEDFYVSEESAA